MLREFEDKENLLAEMEGQVDNYREDGKEEAAARLEDQLSLIHTKFQELSGKFELFQRPSDYDGRLGRITRQLMDLKSNMYLTDLISHEPEAIQVIKEATNKKMTKNFKLCELWWGQQIFVCTSINVFGGAN